MSFEETVLGDQLVVLGLMVLQSSLLWEPDKQILEQAQNLLSHSPGL